MDEYWQVALRAHMTSKRRMSLSDKSVNYSILFFSHNKSVNVLCAMSQTGRAQVEQHTEQKFKKRKR
jgi:hypothetical protein